MKIVAIISEYNPFHNGHKYQIDLLREQGFDVIIAVMSGSCVQRGELAVLDKLTRASSAVASGVDLVVELPAPFSCMSAEYFARAGVFAAGALGADFLSFGCECGSLDALLSHIEKPRNSAPDVGAAKGEYGDSTFASNDILAIEYIRAIKKLSSKMKPLPHKREGTPFNSDVCEGGLPSASALRRLISEGKYVELSEYMPKEAYEIILPKLEELDGHSDKRLSAAVLSAFVFSPISELEAYASLSGGLASRMKKAAMRASDLEEFYSLSATKVYTNSRIRRASVSALCKIPASVKNSLPEYLTLLAVNKKGREYLASSKPKIPVLTTAGEKSAYPSFEYEKRFDDLYSIVKESGVRTHFYSKPPVIFQI